MSTIMSFLLTKIDLGIHCPPNPPPRQDSTPERLITANPLNPGNHLDFLLLIFRINNITWPLPEDAHKYREHHGIHISKLTMSYRIGRNRSLPSAATTTTTTTSTRSRNFAHSIANLTVSQKRSVRHLEKLGNKIINCETAVTFIKTCLKEDITPGFIQNKKHQAGPGPNLRRWRRQETEKELLNKEELLQDLKEQRTRAEEDWNAQEIPDATKENINECLNLLLLQFRHGVESRTIKKLSKLYGNNIKLPKCKDSYINLVPDLTLTDDQKDLLNLGLNCHYMSRTNPTRKRLELEVLLDDLHKLRQKGDVEVDPELPAALVAESAISRGSSRSGLIHRRHIDAAKALKENDNIIIRRADKASMFVILPKDEYLNKMDTILEDQSKFKKINRNPTDEIKSEINKIVTRINQTSSHKFTKLVGEYSPGYAYGTVKTHKPNNPLRPIISQIPTATYQIAKTINKILTPYIPGKYSINSATDFLEILKTSSPEEGSMIASLDVESLFTNVPVDRTINLMMDRVYRDESTPDLDIPESDLRRLLQICTKKSPFTCPRGHLYQQVDGVAMGSPLGVLFANFFMGSLEEDLLANQRPSIYCRYIDDIFVRINSISDLQELKEKLKTTSGLNFTFEEADNGKIPFLDVLVTASNEGFTTAVYVKTTNPGLCMNGNSECPARYRRSTIAAYIRRAVTHCSTWKDTHQEITRATQVLINNGYSNREVEEVCNNVLSKWYDKNENENDRNNNMINLFYKSQFTTAYKEDEKALKTLLNRHVRCVNDKRIKLIIYYRSRKTSNLVLRNRTAASRTPLQENHVVYQFTCPIGGCGPQKYIGMTRTTLSRRLTMHTQNGTINQHLQQQHAEENKRKILEDGTQILDKERDVRKLFILEALYIQKVNPSLNIQREHNNVLPTCKNLPGNPSPPQPTTQTRQQTRTANHGQST